MVQRVIEILKTANGGKEAAKNFFGIIKYDFQGFIHHDI